ncbi:MAG: 8-amino-7-oxononanoate synthase [Kiritimatiellae bacterium]|nr:8-amino-7-oxononanoate synthase [Kiritimatiellia bacterium]
MNDPLYSVKMRASESGAHVSGAERIVPASAAPRTAAALVARALNHAKGVPDFVNVKLERPSSILRLKALAVTTHATRTPEEGLAIAAGLLAKDGISRVAEIMARFAETYTLRGAMLLDADTLERLDPDPARGVHATNMDDADSIVKGVPSAKNHFAEAIVLATKVQNAPGIVAEICVSDDPDYTTGYVATRTLGYHRITNIKERGSPFGGRIFLYRGARSDVPETIRFLEQQSVLVEDVPSLSAVASQDRFASLAGERSVRAERGLLRFCRTLDAPAGPVARIDGRDVVVLSSNDYLDLANSPAVVSAAAEAAVQWGAGTGGSRLTTGTQPPHVALEKHLARFKGTEAALVFPTGYMANVGVISALVRKGDVVLSDALNHASIIDGCRLSGADVVVYAHNDLADLERKLSSCRGYRRRVAVADAVFSMDGDLLDLPRFLDVCNRHDAFSVIDEAHATGVVGETGRGLSEHFGCQHPDVMVGTLSKALGSTGGFVCASCEMIEHFVNAARSFIFSTAPGAPAMAAADAALTMLETEPGRVAALRENVRFFLTELARHGIEAKTESAIIPIHIGDERRALHAAEELLKRGFLIPAIRYPTVPYGAARLRVAMMSTHTKSDLSRAAHAIAGVV